ncbi:hypothetical protein L249_8817 [Ophiocordyceps polyrhachis-furcata BCC 54312]|uniref:Nucleoporin Nup133/Nup155-like C-terminal domain-containing protein n=1 Tax=Ophiocordyceps polyrhachis-furcata BCC 54312 TaxID=1330021 RepID=A0A367L298_9HYPO|nr:hypothetical protein L249_8817 [Ophiocordyceps polyrhachis-furcata BCC 54312]
MFSPSAADGGPATATRSRRRLRPKSSESLVQQPKAKRQRLPLTEQTFLNPEPLPGMVELKTEKLPMVDAKQDATLEDAHVAPRRELTVRPKKSKVGERPATKAGGGGLLLMSTAAFTVSKLPALPDRIRSDWSGTGRPRDELSLWPPLTGCSLGNQRAEIFPASGYALSLTPTHAVVWPYNAPAQSPETFTFALPSASKPGDPLPVASLVSPSASSSEPGLVVVMSGSGKVVYWESISSAATFAFIKRDRSGVEHMISGMSSGEKVIAIASAETAGFVLTFSTGRLAHLSLRDSHGRPAITVQFLRASNTNPAVGIFGSIRHAFSHLATRGDVIAVRADRSSRVGQYNIVAMSRKGKLQSWILHRGGMHEPAGDFDMRESLLSALQEVDPLSRDFPVDSFEAVDFTFVPKGLESRHVHMSRLSDAMASDDPDLRHLLLLISMNNRSSLSRYALMEAIVTPKDCQIGMIRPITSYSTPPSPEPVQITRPRVYLPRPALVAFIVFSHAAVVASVAVPPASPESQLQADSHVLPTSFEDVVDFREDKIHEIVGSGLEEAPPVAGGHHEERRLGRHKTKNPAAVLMVRGAGMVRIASTDADQFASDKPPRVSAKGKLEQAVFFGSAKGNPLVFDGRQDFEFSDEETARAALEISHEILTSTTPYTSTLPVSMEDNLRARSMALERLMLHLRVMRTKLDRETRWRLMFDAEKMHVARLLWKRHEEFIANRISEDRKTVIVSVVEFIYELHKSQPNRNIGETDPVRHWFINDIYRLEFMVAWTYEVIKVMYKDQVLVEERMATTMYEAMLVYASMHTGALEFRRDNLDLYGLEKEQLRMGILRDGYEDLPEPWTGSYYVANNSKRLVELCHTWLEDHADARRTALGPSIPISSPSASVYNELPTMIDCMLTSVLEHARWGQANPDRKGSAPEQVKPQDFVRAYDADRRDKPVALAHFGHWDAAAGIAEKHGCLDALAAILLEHLDVVADLTHPHGLPSLAEDLRLKRLKREKTLQVEECFAKYGETFAFPFYDHMLEKHGVATMFDFELDKQGFKTRYLRSRPNLARISWIHDIEAENDFDHAAETLMTLALTGEDQLWKKSVELSLGRLALLASAEAEEEKEDKEEKQPEAGRQDRLSRIGKELNVVYIQELLFDQMQASTYDAVDSAAALNFALEAHSTNIPRRQKALLQVFSDAMARLLDNQVLDGMTLIDLLTLVALPADNGLACHPFWMAIRVAELACLEDERKDAKRLIWRRLLIRDDWARINDTELQDDQEVMSRVTETELYTVLADCIRFEDGQEPFQYPDPHDSLGVFTETLDRRFRNDAETEQARLLESMRAEDKVLSQHFERNRLASWVRNALQ